MITFKHRIPIEDSMIFESLYEPELQIELEEKRELLSKIGDDSVWMFKDGVLLGETYGVFLELLDEEVEDCKEVPVDSIYCYSTSILPEFQGKGFGKILKAYWLGCTAGCTIVGHSTSDKAFWLNQYFGAVHTTKHENWYGTKRTAQFYTLTR